MFFFCHVLIRYHWINWTQSTWSHGLNPLVPQSWSVCERILKELNVQYIIWTWWMPIQCQTRHQLQRCIHLCPAVSTWSAFSQSDIRAIISAPYLFGVVTFVLFAVATPNKYGDLLFESCMTSRQLREWIPLTAKKTTNSLWWQLTESAVLAE